jgi:hypothetical protein
MLLTFEMWYVTFREEYEVRVFYEQDAEDFL